MKASRFISLVLLLLLTAGVVAAATPTGQKRRARPSRTNPEDASQRIDINNISMVVKNTGSFAYDTQNGAAGLEFPKGTGKTAVFAAGLWMGAIVNGNVRVSVSEYSDDFKPGAIIGLGAGATPDTPSKPEYHVFKLNRVYQTSTGAIDVAARDAALLEYTTNAMPHGAPVVTVQGDGTLNILGDQMLWSVFNDLGKTGAHNGASSALPLGIEVQHTVFAFSRQGPLGNTVFSRYRIINKGTNTLNNTFVSQWSDPDLGGATDDLVGCDTVLSVGYVYNATNNDEQYAAQSPCVGYDFLQGPIANGDTLGLTSFNKYPNGGGPQDSTETYNYMQGLLGDGSQLTFNGQPTKFNVSGDPVANSGFLDSSPSDRRLMLSSGPFTMAPGEQHVVVGIVVAQGTSRIASVALMKCFDDAVQAAYNSGFNLASPPNPPVAAITPRDGEVFIRWDAASEQYNQNHYEWQGYNVYQGASVAGPWTRVATYDRVDGVTAVTDIECDPESPVPLAKVKAFGTDAGVKYSIDLSDDRVRGGPLNTASAYFYTVTAYSVDDKTQFQHVLESPFNPIQVVPQTPAAGVDVNTAGVSDVSHGQDPGAPPNTALSTDVVTVNVLDQAKMLNANYRVGFKPAGAGTVWYLVRNQGAVYDTLVNNWPNVSGDDAYPVVDGIQVKVVSFPNGELARVSYEPAGSAAIVGFGGAGLRFFDGGADYAKDLFGSSIPSRSTSTHNVELRFTGASPGQFAYHYLRTLDSGGNRVYFIQDYLPVPFTVFDTDANVQLNAAFLENAGPPPAANRNGVWDPSPNGDGGREIVWVLDKPYFGDATPDSTYFTDPDLQDVLAGKLDARYAVWPLAASAGASPANGDKLLFTTSIPSNSFDQFDFTTSPPNPFDAGLAKGELGKIRAVPNPYFAHSSYELNRFNRVLKFTHLPARCTIRLFNLAGQLVRTIDKNDDSSQATWDLNTSHGLPVGSGVYIAHIDAPGVGTATVKLAVFMEKERLNNF
jgi:hypothetical protein